MAGSKLVAAQGHSENPARRVRLQRRKKPLDEVRVSGKVLPRELGEPDRRVTQLRLVFPPVVTTAARVQVP